jgi:hypothetical protein
MFPANRQWFRSQWFRNHVNFRTRQKVFLVTGLNLEFGFRAGHAHLGHYLLLNCTGIRSHADFGSEDFDMLSISGALATENSVSNVTFCRAHVIGSMCGLTDVFHSPIADEGVSRVSL